MADHREALDRIFESRARHAWSDRGIPESLIRELYDFVKLGPTSVNSLPARFRFLVSQESRDRLARHAFDSNKTKISTAPCVAIIAYDAAFYDQLPKLLPIKEGVRELFAANPELAQSTAFRNSSLQGAYLLVAARLLGLDCGPMSGFDNAAVDADFFGGTSCRGWVSTRPPRFCRESLRTAAPTSYAVHDPLQFHSCIRLLHRMDFAMTVDGKWNVMLNAPMGSQQTTLSLATSGNSLSGSFDAPPPIGKLDFADGTADGDDLSWTVEVTVPMPMTLEFTAAVSGNKINGDVKLGAIGTGTISGVRA